MATPAQLGYRPNDRSVIETRTVPGTNVRLAVVKGPAGVLLVDHVARFVHEHIEPIEGVKGWHIRDDWGFAERVIRGTLSKLSWHAFGLAIDLNATRHPLGVRGTWTPAQKRKMNAFLDTLDGCVRWGENYTFRKDGMHWEIMKSQADCAAVLRKLNQSDSEPGSRDLHRGLVGADVAWVQGKVLAPADGVYGPVTEKRVRQWERTWNRRGRATFVLKADGVVGFNTWRALGVTPTYTAKARSAA